MLGIVAKESQFSQHTHEFRFTLSNSPVKFPFLLWYFFFLFILILRTSGHLALTLHISKYIHDLVLSCICKCVYLWISRSVATRRPYMVVGGKAWWTDFFSQVCLVVASLILAAVRLRSLLIRACALSIKEAII